ncbi:MAG: hypothetical protein VYA54_02855 [Bdellovibrionota bacterium]|nr:hypothetical protein [Bdellovibrionota bacterium]
MENKGSTLNKTKHFTQITMASLIIILAAYFFAFIYPPQMIDKSIIYDPLYNLNHFSDYFTLLKEGNTVDLQPIRDLSLLMDIFIGKLIGFENFPLITNLIILFFTSLFLNKIIKYHFSDRFSEICTFLFLIHPASLMVYVEFSSRKHILSFLFFLISYSYYLVDRLNSKKTYSISLLSYFLSLLSQPINAGVPLFYFLHDGFGKDKLKKMFLKMIPFGFCLILIGCLNILYYHHSNLDGEFFVKFEHDFRKMLLGINIYYRQIFFPLSFAYRYNTESFFNIYTAVAPLLIITFIARIFKTLTDKQKLNIGRGALLTATIFLTLFVPKSNILTTIFQNYYILTPSLGLIFLIGAIKNRIKISPKIGYIFLIVFTIYSVGINNYYNIKRDNIFNLIERFSQQEEGCYPYQYLSTESLRSGDKVTFLKYSKRWADLRCIVIMEEYLYARVLINSFRILYSDDFSFKEKEAMFANKFISPFDFIAIMSILLYENDKIEYAYKYLEQLKQFDEPSIFFTHTFYGLKFDEICHEEETEGCQIYLDYRERVKDKESSIGYRKNI